MKSINNEVVNNEIKLIKYMGEYRTLIEISEEIDGKKDQH